MASISKSQKIYFIERHKGGERAILVQTDYLVQDLESVLAEFKELAHAAHVQPIGIISGKLSSPFPRFFIGSGKAEQIAEEVKRLEAEVVLFNHELSAAQVRNLEQLFQCRVIDRTELILDIFAQRAHTFEGKLQVELAQLQHMKSRLVQGWTHLERQKGGIGLRGPGETQLETDRRLVEKRIETIKKRLSKVVRQRQQGRRARHKAEILTFSLVGYTNAGKSTVFNKLTEAGVYVANKLFATLDPLLRQVHWPGLGKIILADTVGFIRDLPHDLVAAFRATLEETQEADVLLHVIDISQPNYSEMIQDVDAVLKMIGANHVPCLRLYNKIDRRRDVQAHFETNAEGKPVGVWLSAKTGQGFDLLQQAVSQLLQERMIHCRLRLLPTEAKLRALLHELGVVLKEEIDENGNVILHLKISHADYHKLLQPALTHGNVLADKG